MRKLSLLFLIFTLTTALAGCGSGMKTADLIELEETRHIVVTVCWDTEQPAIEIISPDKTVYDPQKVDEELVIYGSDALYMLIRDAATGQWKVRYDKKNNEYIDVFVDWYDE